MTSVKKIIQNYTIYEQPIALGTFGTFFRLKRFVKQ